MPRCCAGTENSTGLIYFSQVCSATFGFWLSTKRERENAITPILSFLEQRKTGKPPRKERENIKFF